jgi:hypothetical protein
VPFRETIVEPPETDMVNEELNDDNKLVVTASDKKVNSFSRGPTQSALKNTHNDSAVNSYNPTCKRQPNIFSKDFETLKV